MFWWLNHCQPIILMVTWCKLYPSNLTISLPPIISTWCPNSWWSVHRQAALHMISQQLVKCSSTLPHHISPNIITVLNSFVSPSIQIVKHYSYNKKLLTLLIKFWILTICFVRESNSKQRKFAGGYHGWSSAHYHSGPQKHYVFFNRITPLS
jgi:hypothetical protein